MSASLRSQRIRIYSYANAGTDGVPDERYTFIAERWGRLNPVSARQTTVGEQAEHTVNAIVEFADHVSVPQNGALKFGDDVYLVRGIMRRPIAAAIDVACERCDDAVLTLVDP
jgi:hypothetical protein